MSASNPPIAAATIERLSGAVYEPMAMLAGMQLDLFTPLKDGPLSCADLAAALGVRAEKLSPLLYVLVNAGLLRIDGGRFANTPEADEFLVRGRPRYAGGRHEALAQQWHWVMQTAGTIRDGKPRMKLDFAAEPAEKLAALYRGMHSGALPFGRLLAPRLAGLGVTHLADIGGGTGGLAIGACQVLPDLRGTVIDLPDNVAVADSFIADAGLASRVGRLGADLLAGPPDCRYDAAALRAFIQVLSPAQARIALRHVGQAMAPGGHIFIIGRMLDDTRLTPVETVGFNLTFLNVYDDGQAYTEGEHRAWLTEAGFTDIVAEIGSLAGGSSLIAARKPA